MEHRSFSLFLSNLSRALQSFRSHSKMMRVFSAMQLAARQCEFNESGLTENIKRLKEQTTILSPFRNENLLPVSSLALPFPDREGQMKKIINRYADLKEAGFKRSSYLPYVSGYLASKETDGTPSVKTELIYSYYKTMKKEHFWLTSGEDAIFAAMLARFHSNIKHTTRNIEHFYHILNKTGYKRGQSLQTISHMATLLKWEPIKTSEAILLCHDTFKSNGIVMQTQAQPLIALLAASRQPAELMVQSVKEKMEALEKVKGMGKWSVGNRFRALFGTVFTALEMDDTEQIEDIVLAIAYNSIMYTILSQQAASSSAST
ncbi:DUF4003 family protein [Bacillus sp. 1P06AnD]|uniref:DUF4003 family protein n=1 Tax=Bacillus sp. 1P06AnD TaxID=3132208 RepID=UPI00399F2DCA